jgi:hypothetical protein
MESGMDQTEQRYIDDLFDRLESAERESGPRDLSAERYIRELVGRQPAAPYYMAQTMIMQGEALKAAQQQIDELQRELAARSAEQSSGGGSFLGGLFGGGGSNPTRGTSVPPTGSVPRAGGGFSYPPGGRPPIEDSPAVRYGQTGGGGGFLAGAAQTAAGVAGGVVLGNLIGDLFRGHEGGGAARASEAAKTESETPPLPEHKPADQPDNSTQNQDDPFANVQDVQYDNDDSFIGGDFGGDDDSYDI